MGWIAGILNIFKVLGAVIDGVKALHSKYQDWQRSRQIKKTEAAADRLSKANEIENDDLRLKEKMDAMCEREKVDNPDSNCSS